MNEKKRKKIVYGIFVVAVIWGLFNMPFNKDRSKTLDNSGWDDSEEETLISPVQNAVTANLDLSTKWGNDPFAREKIVKESEHVISYNFNLTAISEANGEYWALINGKTVAVGEYISGWLVKAVSMDKVTLEKNQKTISLKIKGV